MLCSRVWLMPVVLAILLLANQPEICDAVDKPWSFGGCISYFTPAGDLADSFRPGPGVEVYLTYGPLSWVAVGPVFMANALDVDDSIKDNPDYVYGNFSASMLVIGFRGIYQTTIGSSVSPHLGAGVGYYNRRIEVKRFGDVEFKDTPTNLGLWIEGGASGHLHPSWDIGGIVRWHSIVGYDSKLTGIGISLGTFYKW